MNSVIDVTAAAVSLKLRKLTSVSATLSAFLFLTIYVANTDGTETSHKRCWLILPM